MLGPSAESPEISQIALTHNGCHIAVPRMYCVHNKTAPDILAVNYYGVCLGLTVSSTAVLWQPVRNCE